MTREGPNLEAAIELADMEYRVVEPQSKLEFKLQLVLARRGKLKLERQRQKSARCFFCGQ